MQDGCQLLTACPKGIGGSSTKVTLMYFGETGVRLDLSRVMPDRRSVNAAIGPHGAVTQKSALVGGAGLKGDRLLVPCARGQRALSWM